MLIFFLFLVNISQTRLALKKALWEPSVNATVFAGSMNIATRFSLVEFSAIASELWNLMLLIFR